MLDKNTIRDIHNAVFTFIHTKQTAIYLYNAYIQATENEFPEILQHAKEALVLAEAENWFHLNGRSYETLQCSFYRLKVAQENWDEQPQYIRIGFQPMQEG